MHADEKQTYMKLTNGFVPFRNLPKFISVRHPHLELRRKSFEEVAVTPWNTPDRRFAVLMLKSRSDLTSKDMGDFLHTIADSQDRNTPLFNELPDSFGYVWGTFVVHAGGATRQNYCRNLVLLQEFRFYQARIKLTVHMHFTNATGNEMGILRSKIKDCNLRAEIVKEEQVRTFLITNKFDPDVGSNLPGDITQVCRLLQKLFAHDQRGGRGGVDCVPIEGFIEYTPATKIVLPILRG